MRVLIVDDDKAIRNSLEAGLIRYGHAVVQAESGRRALEIVTMASQKRLPLDLLITDLKMPGMSGIELLHLIRKDCPYMACILITAYGSQKVKNEIFKMGHCAYLEKPFNIFKLNSVINKLIHGSEPSA